MLDRGCKAGVGLSHSVCTHLGVVVRVDGVEGEHLGGGHAQPSVVRGVPRAVQRPQRRRLQQRDLRDDVVRLAGKK